MNAETVIAYQYGDDGLYCVDHIVHVLPTGPGERFDGWELAQGVHMDVHENLHEMAVVCLEPWQREDPAQFPQPLFATADNLELVEDRVCGYEQYTENFHTIGERL